jgi:hypothetical protein
LVRINRRELARKLHERGKNHFELQQSRAVSGDTLRKIARGEKVKPSVLSRIAAQMDKWPVLRHAPSLIEEEDAE